MKKPLNVKWSHLLSSAQNTQLKEMQTQSNICWYFLDQVWFFYDLQKIEYEYKIHSLKKC